MIGRAAALLSFACAVAAGCAPVDSVHRPVVVAPAIAQAVAPPPAAVTEPELWPAEAHLKAEAIVRGLGLRTYGNDDATRRRAAAVGFDEAMVRRLVEAIARPCLAAKDPAARECEGFNVMGQGDETSDALLVFLAETAEPRGLTATVRLLVRLHAVGSARAGSALDHLLDRRMIAGYRGCAPPTEAEIAASAASLADFAIVDATPARPGRAAAATVRAPSAPELADLAYFQAAITGAGAEVGSFEDDGAAPALEDGAPALAAREVLRRAMRDALARGAIEEHASLARRYLETLGFPGRVRVREERDPRSGGAGYAYVMRDLALSLELLGRADEAEALHRRAGPAGGVFGTSVESGRRDEIEGVIRAAEATRGCRAVVVERLFSVARDLRKAYGTRRLAAAGFDVVRLYRGALVTLGRRDASALERAFAADPRLGPAALARLRRLGDEDWAARVRAISGYAADAQKAAFPELLAIARRAAPADRAEAIDALGRLVEDKGSDPCPGWSGWGNGTSSQMEREVLSVMHDCKTKLQPVEADKVAADVAALLPAPEPEVRAAIAETLGRAARPRSRPTLAVLARDTFRLDGALCKTADAGGHCAPNRPVREAAADALERLDRAEARRAEERARVREAKRR